MFITFESAKINNPFLNYGESCWSLVELGLFAPFLFVRYSFETEDGGFNQMVFLRNVEELIQLKSCENIELKEGYLITPDYVNGTSGWQMSQFNEVLEAELLFEDYQTKATRYKLMNGHELTVNSSTLEVPKDTEFTSIFNFNS